jgi:hypothetical protein
MGNGEGGMRNAECKTIFYCTDSHLIRSDTSNHMVKLACYIPHSAFPISNFPFRIPHFEFRLPPSPFRISLPLRLDQSKIAVLAFIEHA